MLAVKGKYDLKAMVRCLCCGTARRPIAEASCQRKVKMSPFRKVEMSPFGRQPRVARMCADVVGMVAKERERAHAVRLVVEKKLKQREPRNGLGDGSADQEACTGLEGGGDAGLVSKQRGRVSPSQMKVEKREKIEGLLRDKYADFGPTLATEKLIELEGIVVSHETIRQLQIKLKLWKPKAAGHQRVFQPRERRPRFGEMIQIDGSPHDWFEGRAPRCTLIVFIDDATSRLTALRFHADGNDRGVFTRVKATYSDVWRAVGVLL